MDVRLMVGAMDFLPYWSVAPLLIAAHIGKIVLHEYREGWQHRLNRLNALHDKRPFFVLRSFTK